MESDKEPQDQYSKQFSPHDNISMQEQPYSSVKHKETIKPTYIAGKNKDFEGRLNDGSLLTNVVLDEWIKDLDTATNHIAKSARNIVDCLEQVAYEGRRVDSHDMSRIVQPRDELLLHAEVAGCAGRELCRWASSIQQQQQDQILNNRLAQTQNREATLTSEENLRLREVASKCEQRLHAAEEELQHLRTSLSTCEALLNDYHGDAAMQASRLHTLNERLKKTESDRERSQIQLDDVEQRLLEAEHRNRILEDALQSKESQKGDYVASTPVNTKQSSKLGECDQQLHLDREDYSGQNSQLNGSAVKFHCFYAYFPNDFKINSVIVVSCFAKFHSTCIQNIGISKDQNITGTTNNELIQELRRELCEAQNEKKQIENRTEIRLNDLRAQLNQADATNRSLQAYLTFLKRSYASVFQPDMLINPSLISPCQPIACSLTTQLTTNNTISKSTHRECV
uniref:Outer dense fiber protein 2 n=1 Tax=Schistosoma haematobium TaxID=6185 RepID=A0A094ZWN4_SCHHA